MVFENICYCLSGESGTFVNDSRLFFRLLVRFRLFCGGNLMLSVRITIFMFCVESYLLPSGVILAVSLK